MVRLLFVLFLFFFNYTLIAQQANNNSYYDKSNFKTILDKQSKDLYSLYSEEVGITDKLINGKEYIPYYILSRLKPVLYIDKIHTASVILDGRKYDDLILDYDSYTDDVIYTDDSRIINNRICQLALNKDVVEGFNIYINQDSLIFKNITKKDNPDFNLRDGFYELVYDERIKYIIKHQSIVHQKDGREEYYYSPISYVKIDGQFYRIRSSRKFVKLFGKKAEDIRKFMHINRIDIKTANKKQIISVMKFYDSNLMSEG